MPGQARTLVDKIKADPVCILIIVVTLVRIHFLTKFTLVANKNLITTNTN